MKFTRRYGFPKRDEGVKIQPVPGDERPYEEQLADFRHSAITRFILDADTYLHVLIPMQDCGRPELVAHLPELPGVSVSLNVETGIVMINVGPNADYKIIGAEVSIFEPKDETA